MRKTETIIIDERFGKEFAGTYVLRELSSAKVSRISEKYTKINYQTGQIFKNVTNIDHELLWASIKEQPSSKPISLERLLSEEDGIPHGLFQLLLKTTAKLSMFQGEEANFLPDASERERLTNLLLSLGFVQNSENCPAKSEEKVTETSKLS